MTASLDIGSFSKRTLLTGAGWTWNWGGQLAKEIWQSLIGHETIQRSQRLRGLLLSETSFETALGMTHQEPYTAADRETLERALLDTFRAMDRGLVLPDHSSSVNMYKVQELLFRFCGRRGQGVDAGYLFTLNQDLWPERHIYNEHVYHAPPPSLPGLERRPDQRIFPADVEPYSDRLEMHPMGNPAVNGRLVGNFNVIKLHGSFNWRTTDGRRAMVVGTEKAPQIAASPLLRWYFDIFRQVLSAGDVRLMIVGYGFGDGHVNAAISDAIKRHGLRVFIWDIDPELRDHIQAAQHGTEIWSGLLSTAQRKMIDVFPSNQEEETQESVRIRTTLFG
jgi:hypothetical protein